MIIAWIIIIGLCHDNRIIVDTFLESVESSSKPSWPSRPHPLASWSCPDEMTVMVTKALSCSQLNLKRYLEFSYITWCCTLFSIFFLMFIFLFIYVYLCFGHGWRYFLQLYWICTHYPHHTHPHCDTIHVTMVTVDACCMTVLLYSTHSIWRVTSEIPR